MLDAEQYRQLASYINTFDPKSPKWNFAAYDRRTYDFDECPAVPKQRVRGSQFYTPKETKQFEAKVKAWGKSHSDMTPVTYPIRVSITLRDYTSDDTLRLLGSVGVAYDDHGDLDNYTKAITDALNRVAFRDDRQIVKLQVERRWSVRHGFQLTIERAGLNKSELANLRKYMNG